MQSTPTKIESSNGGTFSPVNLSDTPGNMSPQREIFGPAKLAKDLLKNLHNYINDWNKMQVASIVVVKSIQRIKQCSFDNNNKYPEELHPLCDSLNECYQSLENIVSLMRQLNEDMQAVAKLCTGPQPLFLSWPGAKLAKNVATIVDAYKYEVQIKQTLKENIAHAKSIEELTFQVAIWERYGYLLPEVMMIIESVFLECGIIMPS